MKACNKCGIEKPLEDFHKHKMLRDGHCNTCKECAKAATRSWIAANHERSKANSLKGHYAKRDERNAGRAARYCEAMKDPIKHREMLARGKAWREANPEKMKQLGTEWCKKNSDKNCARAAKGRAARTRGTPPWVKKEDFLPIYRLAAVASKLIGEKFHVDHIVPLQGENVSGLHVPWNLRVITAKENIVKQNRLIEELAYAPPSNV